MRIHPDEITSRQNPYVSYVCKLSEKKNRDKEKKFRFDGIKLFKEAMDCGIDIETVLVMKSVKENMLSLCEKNKKNVEVKVVSDDVFQKISEEKSPEGIICIAKYIDKLHKIVTINNSDEMAELPDIGDEKIFILEAVRDPGNLGTVVRTAAAFGVEYLVVSNDCADIYNPKTIRAAMGTMFHQKIIRVDVMSAVIDGLKKQGRRVFAATLGQNAVLLGKCDLDTRDCIVVGNEGHGLKESTVSACSDKILIPMIPGTESLNAAVASSICLWEQFGRHI